jgi:hypothetical protein
MRCACFEKGLSHGKKLSSLHLRMGNTLYGTQMSFEFDLKLIFGATMASPNS